MRLSLSPEARQLAVQVAQAGQWRVQLFDLRSLLEPDLPGGLAVQGAERSPHREELTSKRAIAAVATGLLLGGCLAPCRSP